MRAEGTRETCACVSVEARGKIGMSGYLILFGRNYCVLCNVGLRLVEIERYDLVFCHNRWGGTDRAIACVSIAQSATDF